jgi:hypothetical protein
MNQRRILLLALTGVASACTYNEYKTYNEVRDEDAGAPGRAGAGASATAGTGGAGQVGTAAGAGGAAADVNCAGCLRLSMTSGAFTNLRLEFSDDENLSSSRMTWRMRVRDFTDDVVVSFYAQSGDTIDDNMPLSSLTLNSSAGWQEVGGDLSQVQAYVASTFFDAGVGGSGFDPGFPFDKRRVERVGVTAVANVPNGVFSPLTIEIDSVTFSDHPELNATFSADDGGFQLVEVDGATTAGASLQQVDD